MVRETRHLWVGNLPHTIREERILDHFKRYGKVQSVKILPKKEEESGTCATVAFIDIKSAAKAHNADNKIDERTLKTDYYEPPASSTASSAIYIHERDDALVRPANTPYVAGRTPRYGLPEDRNYERPGHYYERVAEREPYLRRPIGMGYHDEDNYQGRAKSRDRYSRSTPGSNYTDGTERNQNHFRTHNARQHFEQQRYPVGDQYNDERDTSSTTTRLNRRTNNTPATPAVTAIASPTPVRNENRPRRTKRRSPSRTPSGSRSNSGSRSRSRSTSGSRSSSSSSKLHSSSSDSSGRSPSPSKSRSPAASFGSQSNAKSNRLDRPSSAIANPSSTVCFLPSAVNTSAINCTSNLSQVSTPSQGCVLAAVENHSDKEEKRPLGICVRNLPVRSTDTSLKDGLFHEYKKHGKVTMVKVIGQGTDRYAVVCFKKPEDVDKALEVSKDKLFFGCKIEVTAHEGLDAEDNEFRPLEAELDEFNPKATRTLFIGNLEKDITTAELRKHFDQFGEIIEIDIKKQGSATSYAFIQYSDIASVVKAMRKLDGENLGANRIKLGFGKSMPTNCVWLDGIVDTVSEKFLARHFSRFGIVAYTAVDREKGHALVFYESVEFAQIAVSEMRGRILGGKKLQVDFASRECQTTFFDKLEMTGQMVPGDGTRPWERRERRAPEFEVVRNDEREPRVGFENRVYPRYEGQTRPARGNFRGGQRAGFTARGRGQGFPQRYEVYHDEFGERRHRYNSRDESGGENSSFEGKVERPKYGEATECPNRKRNKLRNSISDQESHHSQSPPRSRHHSRSNSPVLKDRKAVKERIHHRIKSPGSQNSSLVNSPCRDGGVSDDMDLNTEYIRDFRTRGPDLKIELSDIMTDLSFSHVSPRSGSEKDVTERCHSKIDCDLIYSRSLDAESPDEGVMTSDQLSQLERKKRFLASSSNLKGGKEVNSTSKSFLEKVKLKSPVSNANPLRVNCVSDSSSDVKNDVDGIVPEEDCVKEKPHLNEGSGTDLKYLQKRQNQLLHLLEQLREGVNPSDADVALDCEQLARKKHRSSSSCIETYDDDITKSLTKDECTAKLIKAGLKDPAILARLKNKADNVDGNNCIAISLDSFIFRKHLDPRKSFDQHAVSLASVNSLQKCRRISVDTDSCLPNSQGNSDSFICVPASIASDVSWKKQCGSLNDLRFSDNDIDDSICASIKVKEEPVFDDDVLSNKKTFTPNSSTLPIDLQKSFVTLRALADNLPCHEIKRERDISPLSLPLPKFAASLRSPKSSPSTLTSPKSTAAHSPRAGQSPSSYVSIKSIRIPELLQDTPCDKKPKDGLLEEKVNGANIFPFNSTSPFESHSVSESSELVPMESIQSPKSNCDKLKESNCSSESDFSPASSPNRPSIEDRIKALDEKFNAWTGSTRAPNSATAEVTPVMAAAPVPVTIEIPKSQVKRSRFNFLAPDAKQEPSEIVKSLLAKSTIFDQDSKRLQHIDEKYEPLSVKMDLSPKLKPTFRTKAAAKEFSMPIAPTSQTFNQTANPKASPSMLVAPGIISPPATPITGSSSMLSPITPPLAQYTQLPPQLYTPSSPRSTFSAPTTILKTIDNFNEEKDSSDHILSTTHLFNSVKTKTEVGCISHISGSTKSLAGTCHVEIPTHGLTVSSSPVVKKEPLSPPLCKIELDKICVKKEPVVLQSSNIPTTRKEHSVSSVKEHSLTKHFNSVDAEKKDFCESKDPRLSHQDPRLSHHQDPRLSHHDSGGHWRETICREATKTNIDSSAKLQVITTGSDMTDPDTPPAVKKRVSSIDSNESDSSKSQRSLESSRDSQEANWSKHEKCDKSSEPEAKRPKLSKPRERSHSPTHHSVRKVEKREKSAKSEKSKSSSKSDREQQDTKCNSKSDSKEKSLSDHKNRDEKRSKSRENRESSTLKSEHKTKSRERRNSEKESRNSEKESRNFEKESRNFEKESRNSEKESRNSEKESRNSEKDNSRNSEKESRNSEKESRNSEKESRNSEKDSRNSEKESKNFGKESKNFEKESRTSEKESRNSERENKNFEKESKNSEKESRNSEKESKTGHNNPKNKKEKSTMPKSEKNEKSKTEKKNEESTSSKKKSTSSKSKNKHDYSFFIEEEPVYFSMYDKVKARSSKTQTFKNQVKDLETMRQKFSKLKQSRAKREDKSKSIDSDKDSDSASHHSSESDSQTISSSTKSSTKLKQQRKRKLVIESSSSDDETTPQDRISRASKPDKDFSDSGTDSDFEFNVSQRQSNSSQCNKNRKKKLELLDSDSSDSDAHFPARLQSPMKKKSSQHKPKHKIDKCKKILKSDEDTSDVDMSSKPHNKEKDLKSRKIRKEKSQEFKSENDANDSDNCKKSPEDSKTPKKKLSKESKPDSDVSSSQKKSKSELKETKHKITSSKDRKMNTSIEKMSVDESAKHRTYNKKRKKSKKISRNKEKRMSLDKDSRKHHEESDTKCSLPVLLSPKPSSPTQDKLSPPHLQVGILSDNDFKSDFSDFDMESQEAGDLDTSLWNQVETKMESNTNKSYKSKKKDTSVSSKSHSENVHSPEQDSSLPSFFDKLSDVTDSETGHEQNDTPIQCDRKYPSSHKKDNVDGSPRKSKHDKHDDQNTKHESSKHCDTFSSSNRDEKRKKKYKKQSKEKKKKVKEEITSKDHSNSILIESPKSLNFDLLPHDENSRLSDIRLDEEIAEEARRLEQELLAASEETSTFGDEGPAKREEKLLERRFEEEAAKETQRLEEELFSTGRDSWHMKDKEYDSEINSGDMCEDKHVSDIESMVAKDDNIFSSLDLHSSITETSQNEADVFLSAHSESDPYKLEDKDVSNDIEDQRKIEDDLAVSALLQEMHCGEISAPELTKETDYLDPLMDNHPEDTMNYLLPDDGENSLHIADNSPDMQGSESQEAKLQSSVMLLSPSSNSEPPSLEISTVEDSVLLKLENLEQSCHPENVKLPQEGGMNIDNYHSNAFDFTNENSLEACESKPPVIDIPAVTDVLDHIKDSVSPKLDGKKLLKKRHKEKSDKIQSKADGQCQREDTDDETSSELADNQLSHFEDITMDTTDSKDDDNPPILLPVESPRNLLPIKGNTSVDSLIKMDTDANQLDNIIDKIPTTESLFDKVSDLDKQIGDIMNSITELRKQTLESNPMRVTDCSERSPIPIHIPDFSDHNSSDSLLTGNSRIFNTTKQDDLLTPPNKFEPSLLEGSKESSIHPDTVILPIREIAEKVAPEKLEQVPCYNADTSLTFYSEILKSSCKTSVIQSLCSNEDDKAPVSKINNDLVKEENKIHVPELNQVPDDSFIIDLFKPKEEKVVIPQNKFVLHESKSNSYDPVDIKPEPNYKDNCALEKNPQNIITPLFEIPEVNEQNEATEFNQEIFERQSEQSKENQLPHLLSFSSEQLFPNCSNKIPEEKPSNFPEPVNVQNETKNEQDLSSVVKTSVKSDNYVVDNPSDYLNNEIKDEEKSTVKSEEKMDIEDVLDIKSRSGDLESVCSDATDITIADSKIDAEANNVTSSEEQIHDEIVPADESVVNAKPKTERTRRGKRGKGRKHVEPTPQKSVPPQDIIPNQIHTRNPGRRVRKNETISERTRRSLRSDTSEVVIKEISERKPSALAGRNSEIVETEDSKFKEFDEITNLVIDSVIPETDCSNASHGENEAKVTSKYQQQKEEPRRKRGRKKKSSDHPNQSVSQSEKADLKVEDVEQSKDFHQPKEPRIWQSFSSEKGQKPMKANISSALKKFDFDDEEDDGVNLPFESFKKRLHDNNRGSSITEQKYDIKINDVVPEKEKKSEEVKSKPVSSIDREEVRTKSSNIEEVKSKPSTISEERKISKDLGTDTNKHQKLSMTIRIKDGHDGTSPSTAEIVNFNIKADNAKSERMSSTKQDTTSSDVPYNGPCKSTRKSTRLANQAARSVHDMVENTGKGKGAAKTRATRRSRSSRRSEESSTVPSESSEDVIEDKNKNEPVFIILDNAVKDVVEEKKGVSTHSAESVQAGNNSSEPDNVISALRAFRITRSHSNKDNSLSVVGVSDQDPQKKETPTIVEEKVVGTVSRKKSEKTAKSPLTTIQDNDIAYKSSAPIPKELPRKTHIGTKEIKPEKPKEEQHSKPVALIDPFSGLLRPVESYSEVLNPFASSTDTKSINNQPVSDLSSISTSVINMKPTPLPPVDSTAISTVNQESLKSSSNNVNESAIVERSSPVQTITTKPVHSSLPPPPPTPTTTPTTTIQTVPPLTDNSSKVSNPVNKPSDQPVKLPAKKNIISAPVGVVTIANSVVSSVSTVTAPPSTSTTTPNLTTITTVVSSPVVSTAQSAIPVCVPLIPTAVKEEASEIPSSAPLLPLKSPQMSVLKQTHSYHTPVRAIVTAVVTATSGNHPPSLPFTAQTKCSASATVMPPIVSKSEIPMPFNVKTSHIEHTSSVSCKPEILTTAVSPDLSTAIGKYDSHSATSANTPVSSTWSNSKASSRITDAHVSTIQPISSQLIAANKDLRSHSSKSPHMHVGKNNSSYAQQAGFAVSGYETAVLSSAHSLASASNISGGVIAEYLQNPQLLKQHKEYLAAASSGQLQERIQGQIIRPTTPVASGIPPDVAARLGNPTPPHTPTPPQVTASNHNMLQSDMNPAHVNAHLRHQQSSLIMQSHPNLGIHSDINMTNYIQQQLLYAAASNPHYAAAIQQSDLIGLQREAQVRAQAVAAGISMNPRFAYLPLQHSAMSANSFRQPLEPRPQTSAVMESKSDQKSLNNLAKMMHEGRGADDKSHHPIKPIRIKKDDKEPKIINSDELETGRHMPINDKVSTNAVTHSASLRQQQQRHYNDRITDSPVVANPYATAQTRIMAAQDVHDVHKPEGNMVPQAHQHKGDFNSREHKQPPIAHQNQLSTYEAAVRPSSRQQLLGVPSITVDGRSANPSHSPGHSYKKDPNHPQQMQPSIHTMPSDKWLNPEMLKKVPAHGLPLSHKGSSISPGPLPLSNSYPNVMPSHSQHSVTMMPSGDQSSRRPLSSHHVSQVGAETPIHAQPQPAHAMSQPRALPQTPPRGDSYIIQRYPVMWQGLLVLKNDQATVQMHFVSGNKQIAVDSLPAMTLDGEIPPVRISQRMRLEQTQLEGVARKMQMLEEHCILMALPCGKNQDDVLQQSSNLKKGFINYLQAKQAAGIVNAALPGSSQPAYVIHIFPTCEFSDSSLARFAPDLLHIIYDITHLVIIIATV